MRRKKVGQGHIGSPRIRMFITGVNLKRKTMPEYNRMKKKGLLNSLRSFIANYDRLRGMYGDLLLENNYLQGKVEVLNERVSFLQIMAGGKRTFRDIDAMRKRQAKKEKK